MFKRIKDRDKVIKNKKYSEVKRQPGSHLTNEKTKPRLLYEYYICDYCGKEIKITKPHREMTGGLSTFPASLTKTREIQVALHNQCLNLALKEFEK